MTRAGHINAQARPFPLSTGIGRSEAILGPSEASPRPVPQLRSVASTHLTCVCPPASQVQGLEAKVDQLSAALADAGGGGAGPGHIGKAIARTMGKRAVQLASTLSPSLSSDPSPLTPSPPHPSSFTPALAPHPSPASAPASAPAPAPSPSSSPGPHQLKLSQDGEDLGTAGKSLWHKSR